jgi:hypothetical protein
VDHGSRAGPWSIMDSRWRRSKGLTGALLHKRIRVPELDVVDLGERGGLRGSILVLTGGREAAELAGNKGQWVAVMVLVCTALEARRRGAEGVRSFGSAWVIFL